MWNSTAIVSSLPILLASLACEGASSPLFLSFTNANADERNKIDTSEEHSRDLHARQRERERQRVDVVREMGEREFDIARNESFQLGRTSSETHIILFSLYLYRLASLIVLYMLCVCRAEHIT